MSPQKSEEVANPEWRRKTAVAGRFYPGDPKKLTELLDQFCGGRSNSPIRSPMIVVPHAGYIYSGAIAGAAYQEVEIPDTVVLLCPNHSGMGPRVSVWSKGVWEIPLGEVAVDEDLAGDLLTRFREAKGDCEAHLYEHANEVHLPFLYYLNPKVKIVPITLGPLSLDRCESLGKALAEAVVAREKAGKERPLILASTDLSHYISSDEAKKKDESALKAIEKVDGGELYRTVVSQEISMCGFIPTSTALYAATQLGCRHGQIVRYGNSGDATRDYRSVVAYASALLS